MDNTGVEIGSFIELDGLIGVVVGMPDEATVAIADDHIAVWFGLEAQKRLSEAGKGNTVPEVWIVPVDVCKPAQSPSYHH